jgi:hypothetical protein
MGITRLTAAAAALLLLAGCATVLPGPDGTYQALSRENGKAFTRQLEVSHAARNECHDRGKVPEGVSGPEDFTNSAGRVQTRYVFRCIAPA